MGGYILCIHVYVKHESSENYPYLKITIYTVHRIFGYDTVVYWYNYHMLYFSINYWLLTVNLVISKNFDSNTLILGSGKTAAFLVPILNRVYENGPAEQAQEVINLFAIHFLKR
jgi:hypothetical protein